MKRPVDFKNNNKAQAWTEDENATLIELWNQGWRCSDIADGAWKDKELCCELSQPKQAMAWAGEAFKTLQASTKAHCRACLCVKA
jgi:hypothetical protein